MLQGVPQQPGSAESCVGPFHAVQSKENFFFPPFSQEDSLNLITPGAGVQERERMKHSVSCCIQAETANQSAGLAVQETTALGSSSELLQPTDAERGSAC